MPQANRKTPKTPRSLQGKRSAVAKFTENRKLPVRNTDRSAIELFDNAVVVWKFLLISLPVDLLVISLDLRITPSPTLLGFLELGALLGLIISASFLLRDGIIEALDKLQRFHYQAMSFSVKHSNLLFAVVAAITTLEIMLHFGGLGIVALIPASIIAVRASRAIKKNIGEQNSRFLAFERDHILLLNNLNRRLYVLSLIPLVFARAASLCAAIAILATSHSIAAWLPYGGAALVLLCTFFPQEEDFVIRCRKCSRWTSRALKARGCCPVCSREEFQVKEIGEPKKAENKNGDKDLRQRLKDLSQLFTRLIASAKGASGASSPAAPKPPARSKS